MTAPKSKPPVRPGARTRGAEIIAALMKQRRTVGDLMEMIDASCGRTYVCEWVNQLRASGVIRLAGKSGNAPVYEMQPTPFALPDTPEVRL